MKLFFLIIFSSFTLAGMAAENAPANRPYDATHYRINIEIDPGTSPNTFQAKTTISLKALKAVDKLTFDADQLKIATVSEVAPVKRSLSFTASAKEVTVHLPKTLQANRRLSLEFSYEGKVITNNYGLFKVTDPDDASRGPLLFTQFEPQSARNFFPSNDEPYDKATFEMLAKVPARYQVISNGKLVSDKNFKDGQHQVRWLQDKPMSTYLVALAIAPFAKVTAKNNAAITFWVSPKHAEAAQYGAEVTAQEMEFFEKFTGIQYPWAKYATVGIPTFIWGGMENVSATFMNEERILLSEKQSAADRRRVVSLTAHELAHQWFGDLVTMKWWDDVWLNEAFATYMATLAERELAKNERPEIESVTGAWNSYFRQEDGPESHPIVAKQAGGPQDAFDSISYTKGANVLRMLSFYIGEDKFRKTLKSYLTAKAYGNATYLDFFKAASEASGENLDGFRDSWILQRGYPIITYSGNWDDGSSKYTLNLDQKANHAEDNTLFTFRIPVVFHRKTAPAYDKAVVIDVTQASTLQTIALLAKPEWVTVNPGSEVLADVKPKERDEKLLALQATTDPDPLARVWAGKALVQGLLDGKSISNNAQAGLMAIIGEDHSPYVRTAILAMFNRIKTRWLPSDLGAKVIELAQKSRDANFVRSVSYESDPYGWIDYRSALLGATGKVDSEKVLPFLSETLQNPKLSLDELSAAAQAVAHLGNAKSVEVLKATLKLHKPRGYRYEYAVLYAFGNYESIAAAQEIKEISKTCSPDLIGLIGRAVGDNQTLKNSAEWANFLKEFMLKNDRFDDEVKARILHTVEEVTNNSVKDLLQAIVHQSPSERLKEIARKMLVKNFQIKS